MKTLKIAGAALNQTPIDWHNNIANIKEAIRQAKEAGVDLLCLPELCLTDYGCEDLFLSDWLTEAALARLQELLSECSSIAVSIGLPVRYKGALYNVACLISDTKILGFVPKQFLANDGVHYEYRWFTPWEPAELGELEFNRIKYPFGDRLYDIKGVKVGYEICEDAWHEDRRPGIRHCEKGVELIMNPSASHFSFGKSQLREDKLVVNGSKRFNCAYLYANLLGNEAGRIVYDGDVLIAHKGKMVERNDRLSFKNVNLITAEIDFETDRIIAPSEPHEDIRAKDVEMSKAITLALYDYMHKSRSKGYVLSLSGGADSSLSAVAVAHMVKLGVDELGVKAFIEKGNIASLYANLDDIVHLPKAMQYKAIMKPLLTTAYQWTANSSTETFTSAKELAESIGATFISWNIDKELKSMTEKIELSLQRKLTWEEDDVTLQNIQARARSPFIWMVTNVKNALLITTSNRSEGDVGYATMDGDTSGGIAPIAGIEKVYVLHWLLYAEKELGYRGLRYVNSLTPTAELRPQERAQTDEKDLMPYPILAAIERLAIREYKSPKVVYETLKLEKLESDELLKQHVIKFYRMWSRNQWKRERIAPSFLLDDFNVDPRTWCRFPILSGGFEEELKEL